MKTYIKDFLQRKLNVISSLIMGNKLIALHNDLPSRYLFKILFKGSLSFEQSESDISSRSVHRQFNLMFTLSSDKDQEKNRACFHFV